MDPLLNNLSPILTLIGVLAAAFFTYRGSNRTLKNDSGFQMLNEHQEEIATLRAELVEMRRSRRLQDDYIGQLRMHIIDGSPPPPPPWPTGLTS